jgi:hypothetical protein
MAKSKKKKGLTTPQICLNTAETIIAGGVPAIVENEGVRYALENKWEEVFDTETPIKEGEMPKWITRLWCVWFYILDLAGDRMLLDVSYYPNKAEKMVWTGPLHDRKAEKWVGKWVGNAEFNTSCEQKETIEAIYSAFIEKFQ